MPCCEANVVCSCNHTNGLENEYCHPYLRDNSKNVIHAEVKDETCTRDKYLSNNYLQMVGQQNQHANHHHEHFENFNKTGPEGHSHFVTHSCPLGKVVCYTDCKNDKDIIRAEDISETQKGILCNPVSHQEPISSDMQGTKDRPCCAKKTSWTEPRICRCDPYDSGDNLKRCGCECGAAFIAEPTKEKPKKTVRFADEIVKREDREKAFRNLQTEDVKHLCSCCKECAIVGEEQCVGKPVLVYELPEPKLEDSSVTKKDFCRQNLPPREVPPWHPNIKDRWRHMDVPSLCETTYQCDYKPPPIACAERKPVYLAPVREKEDPCQKLAEEYRAWKKTSTGEKHTYHSTCDECDKDLHRVHLHECNVAHLPPQYQCHGDGHICQPSYHATGEKFKLCEKGDAGGSRYWWKRTCCVPEMREEKYLVDLPPDLMKPVCPPYITSYKHDFKDPQRAQGERQQFGYCTKCEPCTRVQDKEQPNLLCTKNTGEPFITQRAGII